ncbi:hypothetical protein [Streptomyces sp. NPDC086023]|uniref:hypothetical protein n=1 Tax=Streptomyces sp. NPDC086023 TaxID=3365746 RepID=UPI0037CE4928
MGRSPKWRPAVAAGALALACAATAAGPAQAAAGEADREPAAVAPAVDAGRPSSTAVQTLELAVVAAAAVAATVGHRVLTRKRR